MVALSSIPCWSATTEADRVAALQLYNKAATIKDNSQQIALYKKACAIDPSCWQAHHNLGAIYYGEQKYADSGAEYASVAQLQPDFDNFWLWGMAAYAANDMPSAIRAYNTACAYVIIDQSMKPAQKACKLFLPESFLGEAYQNNKQYYEAIAAENTAIAQIPLMDAVTKPTPDDPKEGAVYAPVYSDLGFSLAYVKDFKGSIDAFNTSISYKDDARTELGLGLSEYQNGDHFLEGSVGAKFCA